MKRTNETEALAVAALIIGSAVQQGLTIKEQGTLFRKIECRPRNSFVDLCLNYDENGLTAIVIRDRDNHERSESFADMISVCLRLADCILHGPGVLRRSE